MFLVLNTMPVKAPFSVISIPTPPESYIGAVGTVRVSSGVCGPLHSDRVDWTLLLTGFLTV